MNRIASLVVAAAAATFSYSAHAQVPARMEQLKPYLQVKPIAGDEETVRVFFSPSCQFSRNYFQFFKNLETTMPKPKTFEFTPLVNSRP